MALLGEIPSGGYNAVRASLDPNDPDYLKKLGLVGAFEGEHELTAPNMKVPAPLAKGDETSGEAKPASKMEAPSTPDQPPIMGTPPPNSINGDPLDDVLPPTDTNVAKPKTSLLGKIGHGLETAGNVAGDVLAPNQMMLIPGTQLYKEREADKTFKQGLEKQAGNVAQEREQNSADFNKALLPIKQETADAALGRADAAQTKADQVKPMSVNELQAQWAKGLTDGKTLNPATGKPYTDQEALMAVSLPPGMAKQVDNAFHEWQQSNPNGTYDDFLKDTANIKSKGSVGEAIALSRLMGMAYQYDPRLLSLLPQMIQGLTGTKTDISGPPVGTTVNAEGTPVGTHSPDAPTGATRTSAQVAQRTLTEIPRISDEISKLQQYLGPAEGRANIGFLLGKVGTTGDPQKDAALSQLRSDMLFLAGAAGKFHLNSVRYVENFEQAANAGKDSAPALQGFLNSMKDWATTTMKQGRGTTTSGFQPNDVQKTGMYNGKKVFGLKDGRTVYADGSEVK